MRGGLCGRTYRGRGIRSGRHAGSALFRRGNLQPDVRVRAGFSRDSRLRIPSEAGVRPKIPGRGALQPAAASAACAASGSDTASWCGGVLEGNSIGYIINIGIKPVLREKCAFSRKKMGKYLQVRKKSLPLHPHLRNKRSYKGLRFTIKEPNSDVKRKKFQKMQSS